MRFGWRPLTALIYLLTQISHHCVSCAGQLQIRLVSFTSPDSVLADGGRCCHSPNSADDASCTQPCRIFFRLCAAADGAGIRTRPAVRLSRISRLRSSRQRRSPAALSQQYTDTAVPSGLPSLGEEGELLTAEHRTAEEPTKGTSIQVIHPLISTAEEEPTGWTPSPPSGRASDADTEPQVFPLEDSGAPPGDASSTASPGPEDNSPRDDVTTPSSPLAGSALVGRPPSQQQPAGPQDIGLVFVEDQDYIHLYFQPERPRTRRRANGGSAGDPPRQKEPFPGDRRQRRAVRVALLDDDLSTESETTTNSGGVPSLEDSDEPIAPAEAEDSQSGSGSGRLRGEMDLDSRDEVKLRSRKEGASAPEITAECPLGVLFMAVVTNGSLESAEQLSFPFDSPWPGRLNLVIEAWQDVTGLSGRYPGRDQLPSSLNRLGPAQSARLVSRTVLRRPLEADSWTDDVITAGATRLEVKSRVHCSPGSAGPYCATLCDLTSGGRGHWRCLGNGSVTCQEGWSGASCDQPVCLPGCSPHTGYCRVPGECLCKIGYHGSLCSKCVPLPGCRHGYCKRSFECRCREGWTGLFCNKPICAKGCDKNRGYCTQPNECRCVPGWRGRRCDRCERLPGCRHGTCDAPLECRCRPGWTGFLCERAICREGCSRRHGFCERPGVCRCELGWRGDLCDTCLPYPSCLHGNCTEPWQCNCQPGWTGFLCDKPLEPCSHRPGLCKNGGTCQTVWEEGLPAARCLCAAGYGGATCEEPGVLQLPSNATSRSLVGDSSSRNGDGIGTDSDDKNQRREQRQQ